jgi:prevent-host-death family protein
MLNVGIGEAQSTFTEILDRVHRGKERVAVGDGGEPLAVLVPVEDLERLENQAEGALREREERLRLVTDSLPVLISYVDKSGHYRFNNKAYLDWFGLSPDEVIGREVRKVLGDAAYEICEPYFAETFAGKSASYEAPLTYAHGKPRYVHIVHVPDFDRDGTVKGCCTIVTDISDRKRAEEALQRAHDDLERRAEERTAELRRANEALTKEIAERARTERALRESEERFRNFAETASDWFWETDMEQRFTYYSGTAPLDNAFGSKNPNSIIGRTRHEVWQSREDAGPVDTIADYMARGAAFSRLEFSYRAPGYGPVHISLSGKPVTDDGGNVVAYRGTGRDITERRRAEAESTHAKERALAAEAELEEALEAMSEGFTYFDAEDRLIRCNSICPGPWAARRNGSPSGSRNTGTRARRSSRNLPTAASSGSRNTRPAPAALSASVPTSPSSSGPRRKRGTAGTVSA